MLCLLIVGMIGLFCLAYISAGVGTYVCKGAKRLYEKGGGRIDRRAIGTSAESKNSHQCGKQAPVKP